MASKRCTKCKEVKPLSESPKGKKHSLDGHISYCKICRNLQSRVNYHARGVKRLRPQTDTSKKWHREYHIKRKYGMTPKQHKQMYLDQNGCCKLCSKPVEYNKLHTDHDHATGNIRGLLCISCNLGVSFIDNTEWLQRAIEYVK